MFEKEAKERARKIEENQTLGVYYNDEDAARDIGWNEGEVAGYEEGFKDGAEFGYNKANELEKEKCELLGLIQAKDKLIEKMKRCKNCEFNFTICDTHCQDCDEHYSNWRLAE